MLFPRCNTCYEILGNFFKWLCKFLSKSYILSLYLHVLYPSRQWILKSLNPNAGNTKCLLFNKLCMLFTKCTGLKNKCVRFEWFLGCNMEKLLFSYLFKILLKTLKFLGKLSVTIPKTIRLMSTIVLCFLSFCWPSIVHLSELLPRP